MSPLILKLIFLDAMFHFACHERIGILLEDRQTGADAEIDSLAVIYGAGIFCRIFEFASASSFIFGQWGGGVQSKFNFPCDVNCG